MLLAPILRMNRASISMATRRTINSVPGMSSIKPDDNFSIIPLHILATGHMGIGLVSAINLSDRSHLGDVLRFEYHFRSPPHLIPIIEPMVTTVGDDLFAQQGEAQ